MQVIETNKKVSIEQIQINSNQSLVNVNLVILPVSVKKGERTLLLVLLRPDTEDRSVIAPGHVFDEKRFLDEYTRNLQQEVKDLKTELSSAYKKLDATTENMQSFNQELLAANEEMQSTNEEMQSVKEELHTINADYQ